MERGPAAAGGMLRLGDFMLDRRGGALLQDGRRVPLRAKTWRLLEYLVSRPGALVSMAELCGSVWPAVTVTPKTVNNAIADLRKALGDDRTPRRYIETVASRGYRWIAEVGSSEASCGSIPDRPLAATQGVADGRLIDRPAEMALLRQAWDECSAGRVRCVLVQGEPGIGKTTLAGLFLRRHVGAAARVGRGQCVERQESREPFGPVLQALRQFEHCLGTSALAELLRRHAPTWLLQSQWLVGPEEIDHLRVRCIGATIGRTMREGVAALEEIAAGGPTVLVIEDLHWADAPTLQLLALVVGQAAAVPLLLLGTYRAADARDDTAIGLSLLRRRADAEVEVQPFTAAQVASFLHQRFGDAVPSEVADALSQHCSGNPLLLRSLTDDLVFKGAFRRGAEGWTLHLEGADVEAQLPEDLQALIAPQIERLEPSTLEMLEVASVAGAKFDHIAVAAALGRPPEEVENELQWLAIAGSFIRRASVDPERRPFAFVHTVYQRLLYDRIAPSRKARIHLALGSFLDEHSDAAVFPAEVASHFQRAHEPLRAAEYLERAAAAAAERTAYNEASRFLRSAIKEVQRLSTTRATRQREAALTLWLANVIALPSGPASPEVEAAFRRAEALFEALDDPLPLFRARLGLLSHFLMTGRHRDAVELSLVQLAAAASAEIPGLAAAAHCYQGVVRLLAGDPLAARSELRQSLTLEISPDIPRFGDLRALTEISLAQTETVLGNEAEARKLERNALARTQRNPMKSVHASTAVFAAQAAALREDVASAARLAAEALTLGRDYSLAGYLPFAEFLVHWAASAESNDPSHIAVMTTVLARTGGERNNWMRTHHLVLLGTALLERGEIEAAGRHVEEAQRHIEASGERLCQAEVLRLEAACLASRARAPGRASSQAAQRLLMQARATLEQAVEVARTQHARLFEARAGRRLRELQARQ